MDVIVETRGDFQIVAPITYNYNLVDDPKIEGPAGRPIPPDVQTTRDQYVTLYRRRKFLELVASFIDYGLTVKGLHISSLYFGKSSQTLFGVTPDNQTIELMSRDRKEEIFEVISPPTNEIQQAYTDVYSNGKLNCRDAMDFLPKIKFTDKQQEDLRNADLQLSTRQMINNWVNSREVIEQVPTLITMDKILDTLEHLIGLESILSACWYNEEKYKDAISIPVIQQKILKQLDQTEIEWYLYLMNLLLNKKDDVAVDTNIIFVRFFLTHV